MRSTWECKATQRSPQRESLLVAIASGTVGARRGRVHSRRCIEICCWVLVLRCQQPMVMSCGNACQRRKKPSSESHRRHGADICVVSSEKCRQWPLRPHAWTSSPSSPLLMVSPPHLISIIANAANSNDASYQVPIHSRLRRWIICETFSRNVEVLVANARPRQKQGVVAGEKSTTEHATATAPYCTNYFKQPFIVCNTKRPGRSGGVHEWLPWPVTLVDTPLRG
jgi:hypothetical protein